MAVADQSFQAYRVAVNKPFLKDEAGDAWQGTLGALMDESFERVYQAVLARFPEFAPSDGLVYIAAERGVEQAIGESEPDYRMVLRTAWELWRVAGSQHVHQYNLSRMGFLNVVVKRRYDAPAPPPSPWPYVNAFARDVWAQFDVLLQPPLPIEKRYWDTEPGWDVGLWDATATQAQVQQVRRLLRTFRAGHDTPTYLYIWLGAGRLWDTEPGWDVGEWADGDEADLHRVVVGETHWAQRGFVPPEVVGFDP